MQYKLSYQLTRFEGFKIILYLCNAMFYTVVKYSASSAASTSPTLLKFPIQHALMTLLNGRFVVSGN